MLYVGPHDSDDDLRGILALQTENHYSAVDPDTQLNQGFVTVQHDFDLLKSMHTTYPAIVAKSEGKVVAYALVMEQHLRADVPVLVPMFEMIDSLQWQGRSLQDYTWFVMGQICVGKDFRGQGVVEKLYHAMRVQMSNHFDLILTEVSERNSRSIRAHQKVGFQKLHGFSDAQDNWSIVLWDWS